MKREEFDRLVGRLEQTAARAPLGYKVRVGLLALLGYGYIFAVLAALAAILAILVFAALAGKHLVAIGKVGIPLAILAWVILRALWVKLDEPEGRELSAREAPELFALIEDVRSRLKGPHAHRVLLTDEYNAAVVQTPRLGILGWQKNHLLVGLPLLQALSPEQFRAVLAHEYGHLAGAHSRFAGWIYRIRKSWQQLIEALERTGRSTFLFRRFFRWYSPFFAAYSFVLARANEYQADRCAAEAAGARQAADALLNVSIKGAWLHSRFWPELYAHADRQAAPAFAPFGRLAGALSAPVDQAEADKWLAATLARKTDSGDTHPCVADRLAALGEAARVPAPIAESAAKRLLGDSLAPLAEELDRGWRERIAESWSGRYERVQKGRAEVVRLAEKSAQGELEVQEAWDYAYWTEETEGGEAALPRYRAVLERAPEESAPQFAVGRLLLERGDEAGIAHLERAMQIAPERTAAAHALIGDYLHGVGRGEEAGERYRRSYAAREEDAAAEEERAALTTADKFLPHGLDEEALEALRAQLREQPRIVKAWLARKALKHRPDADPVFALAVQTRFWGFAGERYVDELCRELHGVGRMYIVLANAFNNNTYLRIWRAVKKVKGARIYPR